MAESRTKNSIKNIISNNIYQFLNIILNFITRTIFIKTLGEQFLGLNGLFTNILSILSLAELGIGTAMLYSMYKPIAENDERKLAALIGYYKVLYRRIAIILLVVGLCIIPLLPYIVNLQEDVGNIQIYYLLYLLNSVASYLLLYRSSIVIANQKEYIIKKYDIIFLIVKAVLQIIVLICLKNYLIYLLIQVCITLGINICKSRKALKLYNFIKEKVELPIESKKKIWDNIKSLLFYQIGNVVLNNTTNIVISILFGTIIVGYYSNYSMIITALSGFTSLMLTSLQPSIGNFNVNSSKKSKYLIYNSLSLLTTLIYGFCSISLIIIMQEFIKLWIGEQFLLDNNIVIAIILNYYFTGILYPNWCYRYTTDLFNKAKYTMVICAILNVLLSVILGLKFGLIGTILAPLIARLLTTFWYEPYILYKEYFDEKFYKYFLKQVVYILVLFITIYLLSYIYKYISINNIILSLIVKEIICIIVVSIIFVALFNKTQEFKFVKDKILGILKKDRS